MSTTVVANSRIVLPRIPKRIADHAGRFVLIVQGAVGVSVQPKPSFLAQTIPAEDKTLLTNIATVASFP